MATSLAWVNFFLLAAVAMLILVPRRAIMKLLPFGIVGGFILALLIQIVAVSYLRVWRFNFVGSLAYQGVPVFLALTWMPLMIVFGYWLLTIRSTTGRFFYIAAYAVATVALEWTLVWAGYRVYLRYWNLLYTTLLALILHYILGWYLLAVRPANDECKVVPLE